MGLSQGYSVLNMVNTFINNNDIVFPHSIKTLRIRDISTCYCYPSKIKVEIINEAKTGTEEMIINS